MSSRDVHCRISLTRSLDAISVGSNSMGVCAVVIRMRASRAAWPTSLDRTGVLPSPPRALPFSFFSPDLRLTCLVLSFTSFHLMMAPVHAACGFAGVRLPPAAPRHGGGSAGRLRDLHGRDRASARRHVRKAEAARRTGSRIVQSGALRASIRESFPTLVSVGTLIDSVRASIRSVSSG